MNIEKPLNETVRKINRIYSMILSDWKACRKVLHTKSYHSTHCIRQDMLLCDCLFWVSLNHFKEPVKNYLADFFPLRAPPFFHLSSLLYFLRAWNYMEFSVKNPIYSFFPIFSFFPVSLFLALLCLHRLMKLDILYNNIFLILSQQHLAHHIVHIYPTFIVPKKLINLINKM